MIKFNKSYIVISILVLIFFIVLANVTFIKIKKNSELLKPSETKSNLYFQYKFNTNFYENLNFTALYNDNISNVGEKKYRLVDNNLILIKIFNIYQSNFKNSIGKYLIEANQKESVNILMSLDTFEIKISMKDIDDKEINTIEEKINQIFDQNFNEIKIRLKNVISASQLYREESKEILKKYIDSNFINTNVIKFTEKKKLINENKNWKLKKITFLKINIFAFVASLMVISFVIGFLEIIRKFKKGKNYNPN